MKTVFQLLLTFVTLNISLRLVAMDTTRSGTKLTTITEGPIETAHYINDRILVTTSDQTKQITHIDVETGTRKTILEKPYTSYTLNSDASLLVYCSPKNDISLLNLASQKPEYTASIAKDELKSTVAALKISPDNTLLAVALCNGSLRLYDITNAHEPKQIADWIEHKETQPIFTKRDSIERIKKTYTLVFNKENNLLITSANSTITLFNIIRAKHKDCLIKLTSEEMDVEATGGEQTTLALHPNNKLLASCSNRYINFWNITNKMNIKLLQSVQSDLYTHKERINALLFHPRKFLLFSASDDRTIKVWELVKTSITDASLIQPYTYVGNEAPVVALACNKEGTTLHSCSSNTDVLVWKGIDT